MTMRPTRSTGVAAVIPSKHEAERIAATISANQDIAGVDLVVVVDDRSTDDTAEIATAAGAIVVRHHHRGKAAAMASGARRVGQEDVTDGSPSAGRCSSSTPTCRPAPPTRPSSCRSSSAGPT